MNGIHDMGGMHGFGPVRREPNEPIFHAPWEGRVLALQRAAIAQGLFNLDEFRRDIERLDPVRYLESTYYERWLATIEANLLAKGVLTAAELAARTAALRDGAEPPRPERADPALTERIVTPRRPGFASSDREPRFKVGDEVVARNMHPSGHTRLPRYVRGKRGVVRRVHGVFALPDTNAHGQGEHPEHVYSVRFDGRELWADAAEPGSGLSIDLWESYLEPAGTRRP